METPHKRTKRRHGVTPGPGVPAPYVSAFSLASLQSPLGLRAQSQRSCCGKEAKAEVGKRGRRGEVQLASD
jgi:hypothetical protein